MSGLGCSTSEFGPVLLPVAAKVAAADAGDGFDRGALAGRRLTAARFPIRDGLHRLVYQAREGSEPTGCIDGALERRLRGGGLHDVSLHVPCSFSQRIVFDARETSFMADTVWHRIDRELSRRKGVHLAPSSWAALGRAIHVSSQVLTNWKARRVPPEMHSAVAQALGWTVDQLLGSQPFEFVDTNKVILDSVNYSAPEPQPDAEEADLLGAFRRLPRDERQELVRDVMARAEVIDEIVGRYLREKHNVTGFAASTLVSDNINPAPESKRLDIKTPRTSKPRPAKQLESRNKRAPALKKTGGN